MLNRSEVLTKAWADYRRDQKMGLGVRRDGPFSRQHFAYCLRMAWAVLKERAAKGAEADRICANAMGAVNLLDAVKAARVAEIDAELLSEELGERINWTRYRALKVERAELLVA